MNTALKITRIGNSAGVVLPKGLLEHLGAELGDTLSVAATPNGIELTRAPIDVADQLAVAREVAARRRMALMALAEIIMEEDRAILAALAKR